MSRERRNISQRKIRKITRRPDEDSTITETRRSNYRFNELSPNTRMYYTKVVFGGITGIVTGTFFVLFPEISPSSTWFLFLITGLGLSMAVIRFVLRITPDVVDQKRLLFSGTFTFTLLFIVLTSLIWMLPGPRF